jgi:P-type Ca2+ transporter type 2C
MVSSGTVVVRGRGQAVVTATGPDSAMGRIAALMTARSGLTPWQHRMIGVGRALAAAVVLCAIVLAIGLGRGQPAELMVITAISLVVAAGPESPPAVVTLALALCARRMTARHALIRRLAAVETLGSVTVLGTDKTGTLTEGAMVAGSCGHPPVRQRSAAPAMARTARCTATATPWTAGRDVTELLTAAALCNDAALLPPDGGQDWTAAGDPTEAALLTAAARLGLRPGRSPPACPGSARSRSTAAARR